MGSLRLLNPKDAAPAAGGARPTAEASIERILAEAGEPLSQRKIRERAGFRNAAVGEALGRLAEDGRVARGPEGYRLSDGGGESA